MKALLFSALALLAFLAVASALPFTSTAAMSKAAGGRTVSKPIPSGWKLASPAALPLTLSLEDATVSIVFALKQQNEDWLKQKFVSVSDPSSSDYGNYLTSDELAEKVYSHPSHVNSVVSFLKAHNVQYRITKARNYILVDALPVTLAATMFSAEFSVFQTETGKSVVKTLSYTIPASVDAAVDFVFGLDNFPSLTQRGNKVVRVVESGGLGVSPSSINRVYNVSSYVATNPGTTQAVASFLSQYFDPNDLSTFQARYKIPSNPIQKIIGENDPTNPGVEATLDVEYITAVAFNVTTWFIFESSLVNDGQEDFLKYIIGQLNATYTPLVHSFSYGDIANTIPTDYKARLELEFQKFGVIGRTILFAAGDNGVRCENGKFSPEWPTSSPSVTSVGGTININGDEQVWSGGGGGFSNDFARPSYQDAAVLGYLKSGVAPDTKYFNSTSRAYPDIAAFAMGFEIFYQGAPSTVGGTSAATPTWASIVSLLNDVRLNIGLNPLGFLNPLLYRIGAQSPQGFHDITIGSNPESTCPGFKATTGWDPASGYGTPDFGNLARLVVL